MDGGRGRWIEPAASRGGHPGSYIALPLWWADASVPDGVFRAWMAWGPDEDPEFEATGWTTYDVLAEALDGAGAAEWLARAVQRCGRALRVVVLDLVDGRLVERATRP